jgi:phosphatidate cytidylyltransferase
MIHLGTEVRIALLAVYAALVLTTIGVLAASRLLPQHDLSDLRHRVRSWWIIVGVFSLAFVWSTSATIGFLGFVSFLALKEFLSMTPTRRADRRVLFYAYLSVLVQYSLAAAEWYGMFIMYIPVLMFVWIPTRMWMIGQTEGFLRAAGSLHWALMITVFSLSHAAYLAVFEPGTAPRLATSPLFAQSTTPAGPGLLLFLMLITAANDIFQYAWGRSLGKRQIAPTVSPRKTDAGLIGGMASAVALATIVGPAFTILGTAAAFIAGLLIAVSGVAGDLCISALKRDLKIDNFGATLPGHGGVLDRADSLVFTAPLFFHFVRYGFG